MPKFFEVCHIGDEKYSFSTSEFGCEGRIHDLRRRFLDWLSMAWRSVRWEWFRQVWNGEWMATIFSWGAISRYHSRQVCCKLFLIHSLNGLTPHSFWP